MSSYQAILFDLDDTLLDRDEAVNKMFFVILEKCYGEVIHTSEMLKKFKEYDKKSYGYNDKTKVLESFFDDFPPKYRLPRNYNQHTINIVNTVKRQAKVAIITNGSTERQKAKIINTNLNSYFEIIIISEETGFSKPDKHIFELALNKLNVQPEAALFVGDDIEKDIGGCQNANINGIWFNPHMIKNNTEIEPYAEIHSFDELLSYF